MFDLHEEIERTRRLAEPGGTVWVLESLAESLPHPTPMTWALIRRMLSGDGGLGQMYRDLGFRPDPALGKSGPYDLIAGRPFLNLSRAPRMQYGDLPFGHSLATLKANPLNALDEQPTFHAEGLTFGLLLRLPAAMWRLWRSQRQCRLCANEFEERFHGEIVPAFVGDCQVEASTDYSALELSELLSRFDRWSERVLVEFARHSLKPGALVAWEKAQLGDNCGSNIASMHAVLSEEVNAGQALCDVRAGRVSQAEFLKGFGHRGPNELELAEPRWCELRIESNKTASEPPAAEFKKPSNVEDRLLGLLALRETAKHYFLLGYFHLRRMLLEFDRRFGLDGGVFFLTPEELSRLAAGEDFSTTIAERRERWLALQHVPVPTVLFSDDLKAIGRTPPDLTSCELVGVPLSAGIAEAPALVLHEPVTDGLPERFVLVCRSTDPAWTPILARAAGLVTEIGNVLSHGAVVAREFGVPAVGGVSGAMERLHTGQLVRVDGAAGRVVVLD